MQTIIKKIAILILLVFCQTTFLQAQTNKGYLSKNEIISTKIKSDETHLYKIKLEKNQFAMFQLNQIGIDLVITTFDADGKKIEEFDSPYGDFGKEVFTIISSNEGEYSFEIRAVINNPLEGNYELKAQRIKNKAITPNEKIDEMMAIFETNNEPGVAVSVIKDGKIIYQKGFGMANLEYNLPITPNSVFHVASVSKQFTAFSILLLEKDGKLTLEDDIRKYFPELTGLNAKITIRNLLNHTSGIRNQEDLLQLSGIGLDDSITNEQILKLIFRQKETNFIAGSEYEYCNSGYTLLGEIVKRVSGKSLAEFTKERIFTPLKMNQTQFLYDNNRIVPNKVYSYSNRKTQFVKSPLNYSFVGSTGLNTTIEDLSLWALNFENAKVGDNEIFNKMQEKSQLNDGEKIPYALGQENRIYKGLNVVFHGGGDAGFRSYLLRIPEEKFSIVVLSNSEDFNPLDYVYKIVDFYLENKIRKETPQGKSAVVINKENLDSYNGDYEIMPGIILSISNNTKNLQLLFSGENEKSDLEAISENEFRIKGSNLYKLTFNKIGGQVNNLKFKIADFEYKGKRIFIKPFDVSKIDLAEYEGRYYSAELGTEYVFKVKDNQLIAEHIRNNDIKLKAFQSDIFLSNEWFFRKIEFIRNNQSKIIGCKISRARATIKFERVG